MEKLKKLFDEKLLKFILVGVVNTLVGMAIMFGLYNLAHCSYWVSSAANYILTSILSYFLNKYFTFQNREAQCGTSGPVCCEYCGMLWFGVWHCETAVSAIAGKCQYDGAGQCFNVGGNVPIHGTELFGAASVCISDQIVM